MNTQHTVHTQKLNCFYTVSLSIFIMVSVLVSKAVDRGFIGGVMVSVLVSKAVDGGFIGGVKG